MLKIALAAKKFVNNDIIGNLNIVLDTMKEASIKGIDYVCFGEAFLQGFDSLSWRYEIDKQIAISLDDVIIKQIKSHSVKTKCGVMLGYIEKVNELLYSSYLVISNGKIVYNYRRISKGWKEYSITDFHYVESDVVEVVEINALKFVFSLCGDLWVYPEKFKVECDFIIWPVYCNYTIKDWETKIKIEYNLQANSICDNVLYINSLSDNPDSYGGCYHFRNNQIEKSLDIGKEGLLIIEV